MSRRDRRSRSTVDDVLRGTIPTDATADELVDLIERTNPTGRGLSPRLEAQRYRLKAQLLSQLLRQHFHSVAIVIEDYGILALALDVSGRSAAHVPLEELDNDVRAVVQRAIDTGALEDANAPLAAGGRGRAGGSVRATHSARESEPPGVTRERLDELLEVWDHAPILAFASTTPHVRLAHAVVHAREGNIPEACKLVADASGARASEVWSYVGENALANADAGRMVEARDALARLDPGGAVFDRLDAEIERRRRDDLARRDDKLRASLEAATSEREREKLATAHLQGNPGSRFARKVLDEVNGRRTEARLEDLLARAAVSDANEAAILLRLARAEGAKDLEARILTLEAEAQAAQVATDAAMIKDACSTHDRAGALAAWLAAPPEVRARVTLPEDLRAAAAFAPASLPRRRGADVARACIACVVAQHHLEHGDARAARATIAGAGKAGVELASKHDLVGRVEELERRDRATGSVPVVRIVSPRKRLPRDREGAALADWLDPHRAAARRLEILAKHHTDVIEQASKLREGDDLLVLLVERDDAVGGLYFDRASELEQADDIRICVTRRSEFLTRFEHSLALDVLADLRWRIYARPAVVIGALGALVEDAASPNVRPWKVVSAYSL